MGLREFTDMSSLRGGRSPTKQSLKYECHSGSLRYAREDEVVALRIRIHHGDYPDLSELIRIKEKYQSMLYVDEAHSFGTLGKTGRGITEYFHVDPKKVDFLMGTMGKALGSIGGYVAGNHKMINYLKYSAPGFVFSVGLTPASTASALAAVERLQSHPELPRQLQNKSKHFISALREGGMNLGDCRITPIVPLMLSSSDKTLKVCDRLRELGIFAQAIIYPAVPDDQSRIRLFVTLNHTYKQLDKAAELIIETVNHLT